MNWRGPFAVQVGRALVALEQVLGLRRDVLNVAVREPRDHGAGTGRVLLRGLEHLAPRGDRHLGGDERDQVVADAHDGQRDVLGIAVLRRDEPLERGACDHVLGRVAVIRDRALGVALVEVVRQERAHPGRVLARSGGRARAERADAAQAALAVEEDPAREIGLQVAHGDVGRRGRDDLALRPPDLLGGVVRDLLHLVDGAAREDGDDVALVRVDDAVKRIAIGAVLWAARAHRALDLPRDDPVCVRAEEGVRRGQDARVHREEAQGSDRLAVELLELEDVDVRVHGAIDVGQPRLPGARVRKRQRIAPVRLQVSVPGQTPHGVRGHPPELGGLRRGPRALDALRDLIGEERDHALVVPGEVAARDGAVGFAVEVVPGARVRVRGRHHQARRVNPCRHGDAPLE